MMSTATAATRPWAKRGSGPHYHPRYECHDGNADHHGDEPTGNFVGQALDGRSRALGVRNHADDLRQHGIAADFSCLHDEATGLVHRPAYQLCTDLFGDGHRFTGDHRFINRTASFDKAAIDRDLFTGANPKPIPDDNHFQVDVLVDTVADAACRLGGKVKKCADGSTGLFTGLQLQNLSQQHQHRDDGCSFEIDGD